MLRENILERKLNTFPALISIASSIASSRISSILLFPLTKTT